jgi:hypothetical protein
MLHPTRVQGAHLLHRHQRQHSSTTEAMVIKIAQDLRKAVAEDMAVVTEAGDLAEAEEDGTPAVEAQAHRADHHQHLAQDYTILTLRIHHSCVNLT